jgi:hypothetical protein
LLLRLLAVPWLLLWLLSIPRLLLWRWLLSIAGLLPGRLSIPWLLPIALLWLLWRRGFLLAAAAGDGGTDGEEIQGEGRCAGRHGVFW